MSNKWSNCTYSSTWCTLLIVVIRTWHIPKLVDNEGTCINAGFKSVVVVKLQRNLEWFHCLDQFQVSKDSWRNDFLLHTYANMQSSQSACSCTLPSSIPSWTPCSSRHHSVGKCHWSEEHKQMDSFYKVLSERSQVALKTGLLLLHRRIKPDPC